MNVDFDAIIGEAQVRKGTYILGSVVANGKTPLGLTTYASSSGTSYANAVAVFKGASTASVYYYDTSWHTSNLTNLSNTAKVRFENLGNMIYLVNGATFQGSQDGGKTWGTSKNVTSFSPAVIIRAKSRLLAAGVTSQAGVVAMSPSRIFFSSVVDPTTFPGAITWNTNPTTGDWIDVNPDDGDSVTGMANTSSYTLVFKNRGMYRLNVISRSVDTDNIFNIGAPSQEAITTCQGVVYFFSGLDIRRTTGDFPDQISRLGVQDFIDAIPQTSWTSVFAGTDGFSVYFSIGDVTLNVHRDNQVTYSNVVLKFSPRDESWSVRSYAQKFQNMANYITSGGYTLIAADTAGNVQTLNSGLTDNGSAIFYDLVSQELDFGNRARRKSITKNVAVFAKNGLDGQLELYPDEADVAPVRMGLSKRVNLSDDLNVKFNYLKFRWFGSSSGTSPVFQGIYFESINDEGLTYG